MSLKCEICGKTGMFGRNVSHSKRSTPTRFSPNIHKVLVVIDGQSRRMKVCTRCLRTLSRVSGR